MQDDLSSLHIHACPNMHYSQGLICTKSLPSYLSFPPSPSLALFPLSQLLSLDILLLRPEAFRHAIHNVILPALAAYQVPAVHWQWQQFSLPPSLPLPFPASCPVTLSNSPLLPLVPFSLVTSSILSLSHLHSSLPFTPIPALFLVRAQLLK